MLDYRTEVILKNLEIYKQAVGNRIQVIWISGTDFGAQRGLYFSRNSFRELYKPHYRIVNGWVHRRTGWKTFCHTCGCVNDLPDDFHEMGADCLNPAQLSAMEPSGMSPQRLKDEYGDKFTFSAAWTPSGYCPSARRRRCARRWPGGSAYSIRTTVTSSTPSTA